MALLGPSRTELGERKRGRIYFFVREGAAATEPNITLERPGEQDPRLSPAHQPPAAAELAARADRPSGRSSATGPVRHMYHDLVYSGQPEQGSLTMAVSKPLVTRSDNILSGTTVFAGTRVPIQALIDYLEEGDTLVSFLEDFPAVTREHAIAVLELAKESILAHANPA